MSKISDRLNKMLTILNSDQLATVAYNEFVNKTPEKTGNAKRNTKKIQKSIVANYPYAEVLDKGRGVRDGQMRGSTQAPQGMTKPTIEALRQYVYNKTGIIIK